MFPYSWNISREHQTTLCKLSCTRVELIWGNITQAPRPGFFRHELMKDLDLLKSYFTECCSSMASAHKVEQRFISFSPKRRLKMLKTWGNSIAFIQLNVKGNKSLSPRDTYKVLKVFAFMRRRRGRVNHVETGSTFKSFMNKHKLLCQFSAQNYKNTFFRARKNVSRRFILFLTCLKKFPNHLQPKTGKGSAGLSELKNISPLRTTLKLLINSRRIRGKIYLFRTRKQDSHRKKQAATQSNFTPHQIRASSNARASLLLRQHQSTHKGILRVYFCCFWQSWNYTYSSFIRYPCWCFVYDVFNDVSCEKALKLCSRRNLFSRKELQQWITRERIASFSLIPSHFDFIKKTPSALKSECRVVAVERQKAMLNPLKSISRIRDQRKCFALPIHEHLAKVAQ